MQEVRNQVSEAMKSKDGELRELRVQNEELRNALRESLDVVKDLKNEGNFRPRDPLRDQAGEPGREPGEASAGDGQGVGQGLRELRKPESVGDPGKGAHQSGNASSKEVEGDLSGLRRLIDGRGGEEAKALRSPEPVQEAPKVENEEVTEPLHLLVQGMRQLQQVFLGKSEGKDSELKGSVQNPNDARSGPGCIR